MIQLIFTVFDNKAKAYLRPFFLRSKGEALRAFIDLVNDENHQFGQHAEDYTLICIGEWDDVECELRMIEPIEPIGRGWELQGAFPSSARSGIEGTGSSNNGSENHADPAQHAEQSTARLQSGPSGGDSKE